MRWHIWFNPDDASLTLGARPHPRAELRHTFVDDTREAAERTWARYRELDRIAAR